MNRGLYKFVSVLLWRPHKAAAIAYWHVTRRRVRARGHLNAAFARLPFAYPRWLKDCLHTDLSILTEVAADEGVVLPLAVHLHLDTVADKGGIAQTIASIQRQGWPHWRLFVTWQDTPMGIPADPRITVLERRHASYWEGLRAALHAATTSHLVPLQAGCRLPRGALAAYAACLQLLESESEIILYGDQDELNSPDQQGNPWLKPDWDPEMFFAQDYLSAACALPVAASRQACAEIQCAKAPVYALLLHMTRPHRDGLQVRHLHRVTASTPADYWCRSDPDRLEVLRHTIGTEGAEIAQGPFGTVSVRWPLPDSRPKVCIIVPTRDRLDLLQPCVEGVLNTTTYSNFEIIIADNGSIEPETIHFLQIISVDRRVSVVPWPYEYNYSAINNAAVLSASGDYLCFLNNDIDIIDGEWLSELMRYAVRPNAGAAGARLLYPDRSIQHAGVVVGMGNAAGHAHRGLADGASGYFAHSLVAHRATAVTAACLVVSRTRFAEVGGFDEENLRIAYNDVDLCLKLARSGAENYYVPSAKLIHHESKSRGLDMAPEHKERYMAELAVLQQRWDTTRFQDPMHHPVLERGSEEYRVPR